VLIPSPCITDSRTRILVAMTLFSFSKGFVDVPLFKNKTSVATLLFIERFPPAHFSRRFRDASLFVCILWSIWKQHNNKVWNNITDAQAFVLERAEFLLYEWTVARNVKTRTYSGGTRMLQQQQQNQRFKWQKPSTGRFKCNIDVSFPNKDNRVGIGICIIGEEGVFVIAKTEWFEHKHEVHIGEALGLLSALQWVHELRLEPIDFELDSKTVATALPLTSKIIRNMVLLSMNVNPYLVSIMKTLVLSLYIDKQMS